MLRKKWIEVMMPEKWVNNKFKSHFASTNQDGVIAKYGEIMLRSKNQNQFTNAAKEKFAAVDNADAWLVAYAKASGGIVVTQEKFDDKDKKRIRIPNVCQALGVQCMDTFQMLRDLGVKL